jgi:hypothetical protein
MYVIIVPAAAAAEGNAGSGRVWVVQMLPCCSTNVTQERTERRSVSPQQEKPHSRSGSGCRGHSDTRAQATRLATDRLAGTPRKRAMPSLSRGPTPTCENCPRRFVDS